VRILVTGGLGFIGSHLVARLVERGDDVVILDSVERQVHGDGPVPVPEGIDFIRGSVGDRDAAAAALDRVDAVVHLAAAVGVGQSMYEIERYTAMNTLATATFLEILIARRPRIQRLVVASSMSIYGEGAYACRKHGSVAPRPRSDTQMVERRWECLCPLCEEPVDPLPTPESKAIEPTSVYAITKRDHEEYCHVVGAAYGIPVVALRFFNAYGSGQALSNPYTGVAAIFSSRLLNARAPLVYEDGLQQRDFIHVSDVVRAVMAAIEADEAVGSSLNVGTGRPVTIEQVATAIATHLGAPVELERAGSFRSGDIRHCFADTALAEEQLGFRAQVSFEEGVAELIEWVRGQQPVDRVEAAATELVDRGLVR
jgi:dTDP-L-rhamnose 4-epimerase